MGFSPNQSEVWCTQRKGTGGKWSQCGVTTERKKWWWPGKGAGRLSTGIRAVCLSPVLVLWSDSLSARQVGPVTTLPCSEADFRFKEMSPLIWQRAGNNSGIMLCCKCVCGTKPSSSCSRGQEYWNFPPNLVLGIFIYWHLGVLSRDP